jgi:putative transport protein
MNFLEELALLDYFVLFLTIALGIAIGKIKFKGIYFDLSAVIFVAIFFGYLYDYYHIEFLIPPVIQYVGLVLFIYTIGMQAGPSFFNSFREEGSKLIVLSFVTVISGGLVTFLLSEVFEIRSEIAVGLFTGALTSTPGLAAAIGATNSSLASIGYGIAYPFGVLGVILFVKISVALFRVNIPKEEKAYKTKHESKNPPISNRNFIVSNANVDGKSIKDLNIRMMTQASISRIMRPNQESVVPEPSTKLYKGDLVKAVGTEDALQRVEVLIGNPTDQLIPRSGSYEIKWFVVSNKFVVNKSLGELNLLDNYHATVTRIRRSSIDISPTNDTKIRYGDKILVSCTKGNVPAVTTLFGDSLKRISETSFLPVALGISLGIILGLITFDFGGLSIKLGVTGGVLLMALILSWKGKTGPIIWNLNGPANQILRHLGLLLFLTPVGIKAGESLTAAISTYGYILFLYGAIITLVPMLLTVFIGKYLLKMNFLNILGVLTGGMTSTPGLSAIDSISDSEAPQIAYAAVYPFSLVLIVVISELLV